jgi:hypothetical protein
MTRTPRVLACALLLAIGPAAFAQSTSSTAPQVTPVDRSVPPVSRAGTPNPGYRASATGDEPDVFLDIPNLSVDEIKIDVQNLEAHIALNARLANLLSLNAGADVGIERVNVQIKGVKAQAQLIVRLDNVRDIIDRTLTTIDRNPQILTRLLQTVDTTVGTVGGVANTAIRPGGVVDRAVGTVGGVANTAIQPGGVVDRTVGTVGGVANNAVGTVGKVAGEALRPGSVLSSTVNALGQTVQRVVDDAGNVVERTLDASGRVLNSRIVERATGVR